jgi:TonB family protein
LYEAPEEVLQLIGVVEASEPVVSQDERVADSFEIPPEIADEAPAHENPLTSPVVISQQVVQDQTATARLTLVAARDVWHAGQRSLDSVANLSREFAEEVSTTARQIRGFMKAVKTSLERKAVASKSESGTMRASQSFDSVLGGSTAGVTRGPSPASDNVPPAYPPDARRRRQAGTVVVHVIVEVDGRASQVNIRSSSGHDLLDRAALEAVRSWRFLPALDGEAVVRSEVNVPVEFILR